MTLKRQCKYIDIDSEYRPLINLASAAIRAAAEVIDAGEDFLTVAAAEELMSNTEAARKKEIDALRAKERGT